MNQIYLSWVQYNVTRIQNARVLDGQFEGGKGAKTPLDWHRIRETIF